MKTFAQYFLGVGGSLGIFFGGIIFAALTFINGSTMAQLPEPSPSPGANIPSMEPKPMTGSPAVTVMLVNLTGSPEQIAKQVATVPQWQRISTMRKKNGDLRLQIMNPQTDQRLRLVVPRNHPQYSTFNSHIGWLSLALADKRQVRRNVIAAWIHPQSISRS